MEIEIHGGINEIGGNKVLLNINEKRFLFDFGLSFNDNNKYFSEFLSPRKLNGIVDYLYLGLIPSFQDFYRNDLITPFEEILKKESYAISPSENNIIDACFLTHAHLDHYKFIGFLRKDTPIYMNWISHTIIDYLSKTSTDSLLPDILQFYERFKMIPKKRQSEDKEIQYKRAKKNDYKENETKRKIKVMDIGKPYTFKSNSGEIIITQYLMDHSIPGACSYIIEHDGRSIIYTGDFRMHGFHSEWVKNFAEVAHKSNPIAIITEGTRVSNIQDFNNASYRSEDQSEDDVQIRSRDMIRRHPGLIVVNFPARNLDRCLLYYNLSKRYDRIFTVTPKMFLYLESFKARLENMEEQDIENFYNDYNIPEFSDEYFKIYLPRKGWGRYESQDYRTYERALFDNYHYVTYKDIQKEPERYLLYLDFYLLGELIDLDQSPNSVMYLYSTTDPFNEEMELQDAKLNAWLDRFGVLRTETIHSSGHCNVDHLIDFIQKVDADNIIPIHTEHPETFEQFGFSGKIISPEIGKKYIF